MDDGEATWLPISCFFLEAHLEDAPANPKEAGVGTPEPSSLQCFSVYLQGQAGHKPDAQRKRTSGPLERFCVIRGDWDQVL